MFQCIEVYFEYYEKNSPQIRFKTKKLKTIKKNGFVAKLIADQVEPGTEYKYDVFIDGDKIERDYTMAFQTQKLWKWRTDPPNINFERS